MKRKAEFESLDGRITADELQLAGIESTTFRRVPRACTFRPHRHAATEIIYCLRGELVYELPGKRRLAISAGKGIVVPSRTEHSLVGGRETLSERIGLFFAIRSRAGGPYGVFSPADLLRVEGILNSESCRVFLVSPAIMRDLHALRQYQCRRSDNGKVTAEEMGRVRILLSSILMETTDLLVHPIPRGEPKLMNEAVRYLEKHFAEPLRLDDLVKYMGYSRATLFALFRRHTGLTPNDCLTRLRIRKAEELLRTTEAGVADVARQTGFASAAYFASVFKRHTGATPCQYRTRPRK